jgi:hypothetical protein
MCAGIGWLLVGAKYGIKRRSNKPKPHMYRHMGQGAVEFLSGTSLKIKG